MFGGVAARAQGNTCTILLPHYSPTTAQHSSVSTAARWGTLLAPWHTCSFYSSSSKIAQGGSFNLYSCTSVLLTPYTPALRSSLSYPHLLLIFYPLLLPFYFPASLSPCPGLPARLVYRPFLVGRYFGSIWSKKCPKRSKN